jgi:hypothetical protein
MPVLLLAVALLYMVLPVLALQWIKVLTLLHTLPSQPQVAQ